MSPGLAHRRGRPLLFLLALALGWTGMRLLVVSFWPETEAYGYPGSALAAHEEAGRGQVIRDAVAAPVKPTPPKHDYAQAFDERMPKDALGSGLEPAPPAHLVAPSVPLESAAAHNALWMAASGSGDTVNDPVTREEEKPRQPW